ncbi:hypothetical protein AYI68_g1419 [Smittium mucronatum]|uniref:Uncharacterized protein n=1 Tax=Smittium mucronatum TaxID=133383 RepID=A0A1R0H5Q1_9FUNG|nr:hypothetical protein AYI68_g1419 [Smittium mucronatum]
MLEGFGDLETLELDNCGLDDEAKHCSALRRFISGSIHSVDYNEFLRYFPESESETYLKEESTHKNSNERTSQQNLVLDLSFNDLGPELDNLAGALKTNSFIHTLILRNNSINYPNIKHLADGVLNSSIRHLDIGRNKYLTGSCEKRVIEPFNNLIIRSRLTKLTMDSCDITNSFAKNLALAIRPGSSLKHLDLSNNNCCSAETLRTFISASKKSHLKSVKLSIPTSNEEIRNLENELKESLSLNSD